MSEFYHFLLVVSMTLPPALNRLDAEKPELTALIKKQIGHILLLQAGLMLKRAASLFKLVSNNRLNPSLNPSLHRLGLRRGVLAYVGLQVKL